MTYCLGVLVKEGLAMMGDTRTNAGVDNIAVYRKLHIFDVPGERAIVVATAGNLATSQTVISLITEGFENPDTHEIESVFTINSMFKCAHFVGRAVQEAHRMITPAQSQSQGVGFDVTLLVGGQIRGGRLRLFMVYDAGNFIEATTDTPYLQIGEHKYGKPILDRSVTDGTSLAEAIKLGLISMDSTMRSNLAVGMPIDLAVIRRDQVRVGLSYRVDASEPYFASLRTSWSEALRAAHQAIPAPPYQVSDTPPAPPKTTGSA
ncbi:MAG: peptidase [Bauldia sp.]|jgi:putative proteasome-type protease